MIETPLVTIECVAAVRDENATLTELAERVVRAYLPRATEIAGVIVATFSNERRFPSLAVRLAALLGLPASTPAFDLQMACSAYPYAVYLAGRLAADTKGKVLVVDGDVQSSLVDAADHATGAIFSDAVTASLVSADSSDRSFFDFLSHYDEALTCSATGPIRMDGLKVFTFVATEVRVFLREFLNQHAVKSPDFFVPHQANPYMIRQLAKSLGMTDRLLTIPDAWKNPGSCSIPLALAHACEDPLLRDRLQGASALLAGFGAGYSAAVGLVRLGLEKLEGERDA